MGSSIESALMQLVLTITSPDVTMPAFALAAELLLESKRLLQARTVHEVRTKITTGGFQSQFDLLIAPLIINDTDLDIPSLEEIRPAIVAALEGGANTEEYKGIAKGAAGEGVERMADRTKALILHMSVEITIAEAYAAVFASWVFVKLMLAMLRYKECDHPGDWEGFDGLDVVYDDDEEDTYQEDSDIAYEEDMDDAEEGLDQGLEQGLEEGLEEGLETAP